MCLAYGEDKHAALMRDTIIALLANDLKLHNRVNYWAGLVLTVGKSWHSNKLTYGNSDEALWRLKGTVKS